MKNDVGEEAREVICNLQKDRNGNIALKTNQIRKFLTAVNAITNKIQVYKAKNLKSHTLPDELAAEVSFLKVKAAYQAGREKIVAARLISLSGTLISWNTLMKSAAVLISMKNLHTISKPSWPIINIMEVKTNGSRSTGRKTQNYSCPAFGNRAAYWQLQ